MSARPRRQTKPTYKARADGERAQRRASTKTVNKSRVNADSPRVRGAASQVDRVSADGPRGPGPVVASKWFFVGEKGRPLTAEELRRDINNILLAPGLKPN